MNSIDRRRFLQAGAAGLGIGVLESGVAAQGGVGTASSGAASTSTRVRMTGDGLGLTAAEQGRLLTRMADEGRISRDSYSNGGTVEALEEQFAAALGKERAVFMPTGTLANHLAVRALADAAGGRAILQAESHLFNDSGDCVQTLSAITLMPLGSGRASFTLDEVQEVIDRTRGGRVSRPVSVISIETPVRRRFGETFDQAGLDRVTAFARREGIRLHLDGARLFLQSAYTGIDVAEYARPFDTVYVSLYKYFNAVTAFARREGIRLHLDGARLFLQSAYTGGRRARIDVAEYRFRASVRYRLRLALQVLQRGVGGDPRRSAVHAGRHVSHPPDVRRRSPRRLAVRRGGIASSARVRRPRRIPRRGRGLRTVVHRAGEPARGVHGRADDRRHQPVPAARGRRRSAGFRRRLQTQEVDLGAPGPDGRFLVGVNETWNRAAADDLAHRFRTALA